MNDFMLLSSIGVVGYAAISLMSMKKKNGISDKSKGFATFSDLKKLTGSDGFQISKNVTLSAKTCWEHICVIGPTGAGKTSALFYPNLLQANAFCGGKSSIVVTDPKCELYRDTSSFQRSLGREVMLFAPLEPDYSVKYNPVDFCDSVSEVIALARDILASGTKAMEMKKGSHDSGGAEWLNMATPLFAAVLIYVWKLGKPYNTVNNALNTILETSEEDLEALLGDSPDEDIRGQYRAFLQSKGSGATTGSIKGTFANNLQAYVDPVIRKITEYSDFDFHDFRKKPIVLYICYPVEKSADLAPLMSIFFGQMIAKSKEIEFLDSRRKVQATPIFFLYDELANIGAIPNFATHASTLRSYRMSLICCLQDKNQLRAVYGNNDNTIFNNLKNTAVLGGLKDVDTLETLSKLCGKVEVRTESTSKTEGGRTTTSHSTTEKDVLTISEIRVIPEEDILLMLKNSKPYIDTKNDFYTQEKYMKNLRKVEKEVI